MGRAQEVLLSLVLGVFGWRDRRDVVIVVIQLLLDCLSHLLLVFIGCFHSVINWRGWQCWGSKLNGCHSRFEYSTNSTTWFI